ncbi:ectoine/hydroxyectoine ABC transporter permease subunit EhuD [Paenibacillus sp. FSL H8-0548]|uniref:ectoine/hydroxyectoine ABC transporter permease subunit EhuD n=1 Tax=Paenibacillus sp. FSL H8-0548 TaxID=1920422 RepID=UPI00096CA1A1|nr:ectoine/hydroxyectoine ABC transporter permease subunit EhuD [Paenibacillus sp. FSL H8-0548]OMF22591.1 ectoine/hydroxyectoine ABC transporter permease subunit EhuD [Paenibacillus sp. FSL H8-0548]
MWKWDYVIELLPKLLNAFLVTLGATLLGFLISILIGLVFALAGRSAYRPIRWTIRSIVEFIRSTPLLVQVFFLYYSVPMLTGLAMSAFVTGVFALGLHYGTYMSEVFRSGIDAVPRGQWEASTALHLSKRKTWLSVILPQALPPIIPMMGNYLIVIFKETPTLSAITLVELLLTAKSEASVSYRVFEPYTVVGLLFLIVSLIFSYGIRQLEKRMLRHEHPGGGEKR